MRVVIYMPFVLWRPHFETDLELALAHLEAGDEVHVLRCTGELAGCDPNPSHSRAMCRYCVSRGDVGLDLVGVPVERRHALRLASFTPPLQVPAFESLEQLKAFRYREADIGSSVASSLISRLREPSPDVRAHQQALERDLRWSAALYEASLAHLTRLAPDRFYLFNGRYAPLRPALRAAQQLGVKTFVHERGSRHQRYLLVEDTYPHDLEPMKRELARAWEEGPASPAQKAAAAEAWYTERRAGAEQAWYSFNQHQQPGRLPQGFDLTRRNVAIFNSSEDELEAFDEWRNPVYRDQTEGLERLLAARLDPRLHFYLRVHPNLRGLDNSQTRALSRLAAPHLTVIRAEEPVDSYALMDACEKVLTFGSTAGIEAVFWGRPSLLVGRALYEDLGGCVKPTSHQGLLEALEAFLPAPAREPALRFGFWAGTFGTEYRYYQPRTVGEGRFLGKKIRGRLGPLLSLKLAQLQERSRGA